jgi:hypothetical protein
VKTNPFVLIPVTEFNAAELGCQVNGLVENEQTRAMLAARHLIGVLVRHSGDVDSSIESMKRAQAKHKAGEMAVMAVVAPKGDVMGMATADPNIRLRRLARITKRLPPAVVSWPFAQTQKGYSPNIAAWTTEPLIPRHAPRLLEDSYRELVASWGHSFDVFAGPDYKELEFSERMYYSRAFNPWTIEPGFKNSPVHLAIQNAGLELQDDGYFDDNEDRHHAVPFSRLYAVKDSRMVPS